MPSTPQPSNSSSPRAAHQHTQSTMSAHLSEKFPRKKVAIIGSGCAGIGALWALNRTHHDVYIYEAADRLGGHTNTVNYTYNGHTTPVDTGFIVMNTATYLPTDMTFAVSRDKGVFEWAGTSLSSVFAQRKNLFSLRMWRMIFDIIRFNQFALDLLREDDITQAQFANGNGKVNGKSKYGEDRSQESIGEYLEREGYSDAFRDDYLIPMTAAVWSTSPDKCSLEFPAVTLVRFMWNHHLLSTISARPQWLTIPGGAKTYIDAVMRGFPPNHVFLSTPVEAITDDPLTNRVHLHLSSGAEVIYDHVILATHGDTAHNLIRSSSTPLERSILSAFQTSKNTAVLHSDLSLMPRNRSAWAAWNYLTSSSSSNPNTPYPSADPKKPSQVCLTYNMNILQHLPVSKFSHILVTLNPLSPPAPTLTHSTYTYRHPLYTTRAIAAQKELDKIQNTRNISYAGAWTGYGFHEDAFTSGVRVARDHLGAAVPFRWKESEFARGRRPVMGWKEWVVRWVVGWVQVWVGLLDWILGLVWKVLGVGVEVLEVKVLGEGKVGVEGNGKRRISLGIRGEDKRNGNGITNGNGNGVLMGKGRRKKIE
ncbi:amine oxidase protein [Rutstroemia sp. NJR-2017a WRK4]|nr:amine oxidase protein [Rutstroemia sp. NJR-2017a WRK4]